MLNFLNTFKLSLFTTWSAIKRFFENPWVDLIANIVLLACSILLIIQGRVRDQGAIFALISAHILYSFLASVTKLLFPEKDEYVDFCLVIAFIYMVLFIIIMLVFY